MNRIELDRVRVTVDFVLPVVRASLTDGGADDAHGVLVRGVRIQRGLRRCALRSR